MRTRLTVAARRMSPLVAIFAIVVALVSVNAASASPNSPLRSDTTYEFVGDVIDPERGMLLVWEGTITGAFDGCIQWWSADAPTITGQASHYDESWEIWDECENHEGETLLLSGNDRGATTVRHFENSIWRANGVVTGPEGSELIGRRMHSGGSVEWNFTGAIPAPMSGEGVFRVNR